MKWRGEQLLFCFFPLMRCDVDDGYDDGSFWSFFLSSQLLMIFFLSGWVVGERERETSGWLAGWRPGDAFACCTVVFVSPSTCILLKGCRCCCRRQFIVWFSVWQTTEKKSTFGRWACFVSWPAASFMSVFFLPWTLGRELMMVAWPCGAFNFFFPLFFKVSVSNGRLCE